jgi:hypothetical protein
MNGNLPDATPLPPPWFFWPLLSLGIALSAFVTAAFVSLLFHLPPVFVLSVDATLAALVVGLPAWYWCIVLPRRATLQRGTAVGAIGSLFAYPVMWMFAGFIGRQAVFGTVDVVPLVPLWTFLGWLYAGWITTPLGAVAGWLLVSLQRALTSAVQAHPSDSRGAATTRDDTP